MEDLKKHFVIDLDMEDGFVRVVEVAMEFTTEVGDRGMAYHRSPSASSLINEFLTKDNAPKFYGQLDALLVTKPKLQAAPPIVPADVQDFLASPQAQTEVELPGISGPLAAVDSVEQKSLVEEALGKGAHLRHLEQQGGCFRED